MLLLQHLGAPVIVAALMLPAVALAGCGAEVVSHAGVQATSVTRFAESVPPSGTAATDRPPSGGEAGDTTASSHAGRSDGQPDSVHSTSIATLRLITAGDGKSVEIRVNNVIELYAVDIKMKYDSARLQVADADTRADGVQIQPGQVPRPDFVAVNSADNRTGVVRYVVTQLGEAPALSGGGVVATVFWQDTPDPNATLALVSVTLVGDDAQPIEVVVIK